MKQLAKRLLVLSFDAMGSKDLEKVKNYPNFKRLLDGASFSNQVQSVSPSLTYPAHTSIITSSWPKTHGIIANTRMQVNRESPDWYWQRKFIKVETLYDQAIKEGMKVAALLWPVTAKSKIQYNFPEIFANRPWQNQVLVSLLNGSAAYQYKLNKKFKHLRKGIDQPWLDDFVEASLLETIKTHRPELILSHFVDLDSMRHQHGYDSKQAQEALIRHDKRLGRILDLLEEEKLDKETVVVLLGDHDHRPTHSVISLRRLLLDKGLIRYKDDQIESYDVMTKTADGSTYIYLKDQSMIDKMRLLLKEFKESSQAIDKILEKDEIIEYGADPQADFLVNAKAGYYFTDRLEKMVINKIETDQNGAKEGYLLSSHGYLSDDEDYQTIFIIKGPGIKADYDIGPMHLIDQGVTFAKILGLSLANAQGRILEEIFE